jgi:uncharacterized protein involved in exopolysaccharide biosynthesis/Mrp family chromosome partitioning ATPase
MFTTETAMGKQEEREERCNRPTMPAAAAVPSGPALLTGPAGIFATLWKRKRLIVVAALAGAGIAGLASFMGSPTYVSTAQIFIDPRDQRPPGNDDVPNPAAGDPASISGYLESQTRLIASVSIKSRVVESERLDRDPEFGGEVPRTGLDRLLGDILSGSEAPPHDGMLHALAALEKNVSVRRGEGSFVVDITVTAHEPAKAARIANALANAYLEDQASIRADTAKRAAAALAGRLEELRNRLRTAEDKVQKYKEANRIIGVGGGKTMNEEQLGLNNAQLAALRMRVAEARAKYDQTLATRPSSIEAGAIPDVVASNTMTDLRAQLAAALAREADLLRSLGARHPALTAAQSQLRDARRQITDELARISRSAKAEYDRAVEAERLIARRVEQLTTAQYAAGRASIQLRELEREVESTRVAYDALLRRARETGEQTGLDTTNARIISAAMPALETSGVNWRRFAVLGGLAGVAIGAALALLLGASGAVPSPAPKAMRASGFAFWRRKTVADVAGPADTTSLEPDAVEHADPPPAPIEHLGDPGMAPASTRDGSRRFTTIQGGQSQRLPDTGQAAATPILATLPVVRHRRWRRNDGEARSIFQSKAHLVDVIDKPNAGFARAIRLVRSALAAQEQGQRRILILGLRSHAGASTLALNLALDAALAGLPALLVDSGSGENRLSRVYAPGAEAGLHEIVTGAADVMRVALPDKDTGLHLLPRSGRTDLVTSEQIERGFVEDLRRFGPIVIDGAAIGSDELSQRFADAADDIVLVMREGAAGDDDIEQAKAALGENAAKIRGFVINEAG